MNIIINSLVHGSPLPEDAKMVVEASMVVMKDMSEKFAYVKDVPYTTWIKVAAMLLRIDGIIVQLEDHELALVNKILIDILYVMRVCMYILDKSPALHK